MSATRSKRRWSISGAVAIAAVLMSTLAPTSATAAPAECVDGQLITADCVDTQYATPVIDAESDETSPVAHHRISGHFDGTDIQFNVYLPPAAQWKGRFYQYTYPLTDANATARAIGFGVENGGYTVQAGSTAGPSLGYRHAAAAAKIGRTLAAAYYGVDAGTIPGYLYGPSGGSFQTIGAAEGSTGVWQGFVPMVLGDPMATPYTFFIRAMARLVLEDDAAAISDAVSPGGNGDPYASLDEAERAFLREMVSFGVPLKAWEDPNYLLGLSTSDGLLGFGEIVKQIDPTYADDFWSAPGYLGTEQSPLGDLVRAALAAGGDRWGIALGTYHRHQLPPADAGYYGFDQFRNADGTPRYPQRSLVIGPLVLGSSSGNAAYSGTINGKVIIVDNLLDVDALAWRADWYAKRVRASLGQQGFQSNFRLYLNERADHIEGEKTGAAASRLINYWGSVEQALRDISAWSEQGKAAPASTGYTVSDAQISVPRIALQRKGIQPVVDLTANLRDEVVKVRKGQKVGFAAAVQLPTTTARVVSTEWDFDGDGTYESRSFRGGKLVVAATASFTYPQPGTYFVSIR
ncbi:MAG: PKD domain-containing protein, partial [Microvirga sp.]